MVRFKREHTEGTGAPVEFQFLYGAIQTAVYPSSLRAYLRFNSYMVRFKLEIEAVGFPLG